MNLSDEGAIAAPTSGPDAPAPAPTVDDVDPPPPSHEFLSRWGARVLDPLTAPLTSGEVPPRPTVYLAGTLLVPPEVLSDFELAGLLHEAARDRGCALVEDDDSATARAVNSLARLPARLRLVPLDSPDPDAPRPDVDAWSVLQRFRQLAHVPARREDAAGVGLEHLAIGGSSAAAPETGRSPVTWVGPPPPRAAIASRRPVVALLDTGCGRHTWFDIGRYPGDPIVVDGYAVSGVSAQVVDMATDPEITGDLVGPTGGLLDSHSGHGTFAAGLVHQICPDARLLAIRVMHSDGAVREWDLLRALHVLLAGIRAQLSGDEGGLVLDVVSLSLGFYHESYGDESVRSPLLAPILELARLGVAVVSSAGNDGTRRPMVPAAYTPHPGGPLGRPERDVVPPLSVGARNPDGSITLSSNAGPWVSAWDFGTAMVSTFPITFHGGAAPVTTMRDPQTGGLRRSIDPDSFAGGFGVWTGTSFAAAVLAARLARGMVDDPDGSTLDDTSVGASVDRAWRAIATTVHIARP